MDDGMEKKRVQSRIATLLLVILMLCAGIVAMAYGLHLSEIEFFPRQRWVRSAIRSGESTHIILASDVAASRANIEFSLYNAGDDTWYGAHWELAHLRFGRWRPVPWMRGIGRAIPGIQYTLAAGETMQYRIRWDYLFGELRNGRYMFIREYAYEFVLIEFTVDADAP